MDTGFSLGFFLLGQLGQNSCWQPGREATIFQGLAQHSHSLLDRSNWEHLNPQQKQDWKHWFFWFFAAFAFRHNSQTLKRTHVAATLSTKESSKATLWSTSRALSWRPEVQGAPAELANIWALGSDSVFQEILEPKLKRVCWDIEDVVHIEDLVRTQ